MQICGHNSSEKKEGSYAGKVREKRTSSFEILKPKHIFFLGKARESNAREKEADRTTTSWTKRLLLSSSAPFKSKTLLVLRSTIKTLICHFGPISHAFTTLQRAAVMLLLRQCCPRTRIRSVKVENSIWVYALLRWKIEEKGPFCFHSKVKVISS